MKKRSTCGVGSPLASAIAFSLTPSVGSTSAFPKSAEFEANFPTQFQTWRFPIRPVTQTTVRWITSLADFFENENPGKEDAVSGNVGSADANAQMQRHVPCLLGLAVAYQFPPNSPSVGCRFDQGTFAEAGNYRDTPKTER